MVTGPLPRAPATLAVVTPVPRRLTGPLWVAELLLLMMSVPAPAFRSDDAPEMMPLRVRVLEAEMSNAPPPPMRLIARLVDPLAPVKRRVPSVLGLPRLMVVPEPSGPLA